MNVLTRRSLLLSPLAALPIAPAMGADAPRVVAVLSLIGDELHTVVRRIATNVDRNERQSLPVEDTALDSAALAAGDRAIAEAMPGAERLRVAIRDKRLFGLQEGLLEPGTASDGMREALKALLAKAQATHLLLVTKRRDDARFKLAYGNTTGAGRISGVGIYFDTSMELVDAQTSETTVGYYVCYAYVRVWLLEASSLRVLASRPGSDHLMTTALRQKSAMAAWDARSPEEKMRDIVRVIDQAVYGAAREIAKVS